MKEATLIKKLTKMFPESMPVSLNDWNGSESPGIWFRGSEDVLSNGERVFDYYCTAWNYGLNPRIEAVLRKAGWYSEPWDAGTCMAYPI